MKVQSHISRQTFWPISPHRYCSNNSHSYLDNRHMAERNDLLSADMFLSSDSFCRFRNISCQGPHERASVDAPLLERRKQ